MGLGLDLKPAPFLTNSSGTAVTSGNDAGTGVAVTNAIHSFYVAQAAFCS